MLFYQPLCLVLIAATLLVVHSSPPGIARQRVLLAASLAFYAYSGLGYLVLLLGVVVVNYGASRHLHGPHGGKIFAATLVGNLFVLFFFKYAEFFLVSAGLVNTALPHWWHKWALPTGLSFYTFQIISYQVDIRTRKGPPAADFWEFMTFAFLFAHLIAGPIVRGHELLEQLRAMAAPTVADVSRGAYRFLSGYIKKVFLVNMWLSPMVDGLLAEPSALTSAELFLAISLFGFQIYLDFSGYCDMAIGIARMMGIRFPENFRTPYLARSPGEFWNRWNITLSHWIRDYLYIPLGGNRRSPWGNAVVAVTTMAACGLWHGAAWGFVVWGIYHGLVILAGRGLAVLFPESRRGLAGAARSALAWGAMFLAAQFGWLFFRLTQPAQFIQALGFLFDPARWIWTVRAGELLALSGVLLVLHVAESLMHDHADGVTAVWGRLPSPLRGLAYAAIVVAALPSLFSNATEPFIYFRF